MHNKKLMSVVVPFYNIGDYVKKTINSLELQTYRNFEVIFVNDGSKDNSLDIVEGHLKNVSFEYKIINLPENKGLSNARNIGIDESKGEYIYFLDSDDYISENAIEKIMEMFSYENPDIVVFEFRRVDENYNFLYHYNDLYKDLDKIMCSRDVLIKYINLEIFIYSCSAAYKKEAIENIYFDIDCPRSEDQDFNIRVLLNTNTVGYINSELVSYYKRKGSMTAEKFNSKDLYILKILNTFYKTFKENDIELADHLANRRAKELLKLVKVYIRKVPESNAKEIRKFIKTNILTNKRSLYLSNKYMNGLSSENIQIFLLRYFPTLFIHLFRYNQKRIYE